MASADATAPTTATHATTTSRLRPSDPAGRRRRNTPTSTRSTRGQTR